MSKVVLVIGESGSGKSTSIRTLKPEETFILGVVNKPLPFRGASAKYTFYSPDNNPTGNFYVTDDHKKIMAIIKKVNSRPEIKTFIIDDFQYTMSHYYMSQINVKSYDKFIEIGVNVKEIIDALVEGRADLNCYILSHSDMKEDGQIRPMTVGKMVDNYVKIEGRLTFVLHAVYHDGSYKFLTNNHGARMAKTPLGMFNELLIDNDLNLMNQKLSEY